MVAESKNFSAAELCCSCCGADGVKQSALDILQKIRDEIGRPLRITSAYRCANHPNERVKTKPGTHNLGVAFDIAVSNGAERRELVRLAEKYGARGIGVAKTFVHMDFSDGAPVMWTYS